MDNHRWEHLVKTGEGLTIEEMNQGWHWCPNSNFLLVGPNCPDALICSCNIPVIENWKNSKEAKIIEARYINKSLNELVKLDEELGLI